MDGEVVDQATAIRDKCSSTTCKTFKEKFDQCNQRSAKNGYNENCEEELYDMLKCVDKCAANEVFKRLK